MLVSELGRTDLQTGRHTWSLARRRQQPSLLLPRPRRRHRQRTDPRAQGRHLPRGGQQAPPRAGRVPQTRPCRGWDRDSVSVAGPAGRETTSDDCPMRPRSQAWMIVCEERVELADALEMTLLADERRPGLR